MVVVSGGEHGDFCRVPNLVATNGVRVCESPKCVLECFVVGILLWGVIRRITELPGSFHSHGVWVILRVAALLLEITAVAIGSAIVAKTWQEPQASV
jgi:fructose-specific phosphotransferase system IIC component